MHGAIPTGPTAPRSQLYVQRRQEEEGKRLVNSEQRVCYNAVYIGTYN